MENTNKEEQNQNSHLSSTNCSSWNNFSDYAVLNFNSDKEYQKEIESFLLITKDNLGDWKKRENALRKFGGIIQGNYAFNPEFFKILNSKIYLNFYAQISDLRSSLMKEACRVFVFASQIYKKDFEPIADKLFHANYFYKLLACQNRVIADNIHNCMISVLSNVQSGKLLVKIYEQHKTKSNQVRIRVCQQMYFCITNYDYELLEKHFDVIESLIIKLSPDATSDVRQQARKIYFKYVELNPDSEEGLLNVLEHNVIKQLKDDRRKIDDGTFEFGNDFSMCRTIKSNNYNSTNTSILSPAMITKSTFTPDGSFKTSGLSNINNSLNNIDLSKDNFSGSNLSNQDKIVKQIVNYEEPTDADNEKIKNSMNKNLVQMKSVGRILNKSTNNSTTSNNKYSKTAVKSRVSGNFNSSMNSNNNNHNNTSNIKNDNTRISNLSTNNKQQELPKKIFEAKNRNLQFNNNANSSITKNNYDDEDVLDDLSTQKQSDLTKNSIILNSKKNIGINSVKQSDLPKSSLTPKKSKIENIERMVIDILLKANKKDVTSKIQAFEMISISFNDILANISLIHSKTVEELINSHINNLCMGVNKLSVQIMKNLTKFIFYLINIFSEDELNKMTKLILVNMTVEDTIVCQTASSLIDVLMQKVDSNELIKPIIESITSNSFNELNVVCVDIIRSMMHNIEENLSNNEFCKNLLLKIIFILNFKQNESTKVKLIEIIEEIALIKKDSFESLFLDMNEKQKLVLVNFILKYKPDYKVYFNSKGQQQSKVHGKSELSNNSKLNLMDKFNNFNQTSNNNINEIKINSNNINSNQNSIINNTLNKPTLNNYDTQTESLSLASEFNYDSFLNFLFANKNNIEVFLFGITKVKPEQVEGVLFQLTNLLNLNYYIVKDNIPLLFNRCLYLAERFTTVENQIINLINLIVSYTNAELYIQIATKYLNDRNSTPIMKCILTSISNVISKINPEALLLLLPSFYENISNCLNHSVSEIRKLVVLIIVDLYFAIGEDFNVYLDGLNVNHRNIINIYIKKRQGK